MRAHTRARACIHTQPWLTAHTQRERWRDGETEKDIKKISHAQIRKHAHTRTRALAAWRLNLLLAAISPPITRPSSASPCQPGWLILSVIPQHTSSTPHCWVIALLTGNQGIVFLGLCQSADSLCYVSNAPPPPDTLRPRCPTRVCVYVRASLPPAGTHPPRMTLNVCGIIVLRHDTTRPSFRYLLEQAFCVLDGKSALLTQHSPAL